MKGLVQGAIDKKTFIKEYSESISQGKASLFIGSGLSRPELPGWKDVLAECANDIGLSVDYENDLIALAQYYVNSNQRTKITNTIKEFFADNKSEPKENHFLLADLPNNSVWTTNYDRLLERTYEIRKISYSVLTNDKSYRNFNSCSKVIIHKIHGDVNNADETVITRDDYESFVEKNDIVLSELKGELCSKSFLFLGYSFSDTDIQHILTRIRLIHDNRHPQRHYCIFEQVKRETSDTDEIYSRKCKKQEHLIIDFKKYGINPILVGDYKTEITDILKQINKRVLLKNVLICGAYDDDFVHAGRSAKVAQKIASELIQNGYKIFTGYGKNLGSEIVAGAFDGCTKMKKEVKDFNDTVFLFPFPYRKDNTIERKEMYTQLRKNMVAKTQIAIIIAGYKNDGLPSGIIEEVELLEQSGKLVIPLSSTGGYAMTIWNKMSNIKSEYTISKDFQALKTATHVDDIWNLVFQIIKKYINQT